MIEARGITKRFGAVEVLRGLDLTIRPGRVTAIVGPNGAGKTTFIKSVLGLTRPDGGRLLFDGAPLDADGAHRARIGYMPQAASFPANLTGDELLALMSDLRGRPADADRELIERFALQPHLGKPLRTLSGGTRQKVNAALAFLFRPVLLVLDEPTAGLDPVASGILKDKIARERAGGRTVILTSHVMAELEELADDVAFLLDGRAGFTGDVRDLKRLTRQATLERAVASAMTGGLAA